MKILFAASEALPFIATGGLADVAGSLPRALNGLGCDCRVVLPLYSEIGQKFRENMTFLCHFNVPLSWRRQYCGVFEAQSGGVTYYLLDNEYYFKRNGIYGHYDDGERFAFFSRAALEMLDHIDFRPDVIHANDWHTALIPAFYRAFYAERGGYSGMKTVFTIHNVQYQGRYGSELLEDVLGLPEWIYPLFEHEDSINFMKAAMLLSDRVTTVSPTYAKELRYPFYAHGLSAVFDACAGKMTGILNGIDNDIYNPETDENLFAPFSVGDPAGKAENRRGLQKLLGLPEDDGAMIIGMVTRLVGHKGIDLLRYILDELMDDPVQLILLGKGDLAYEQEFTDRQHRYPAKLAVKIGFMNDLARKIYAGADTLLMPSQSEPCGLAQMVALRYGTVPIVRETGGLKDSIHDCGDGKGNGFTFSSFNAHDMLAAVRRAEDAFADRERWEVLNKRAMECDFSWDRSAAEYAGLYRSI